MFIWSWNPRSASFLKLHWEAGSAMMFSSDGIQKMVTSISNIAAISSVACNGLSAGPFIECLLMASTTAELSQAIRTCPVVHCSCHNRKA